MADYQDWLDRLGFINGCVIAIALTVFLIAPTAGQAIERDPSHQKKESIICQKLAGINSIEKEMRKLEYGSAQYAALRKKISPYRVDSESLDDSDSIYKNVDIDRDGKIDKVWDSCGSGRYSSCIFKAELSNGGAITTEEIAHFDMLYVGNHYYLRARYYDIEKPYIQFYIIKHTSIHPLCSAVL